MRGTYRTTLAIALALLLLPLAQAEWGGRGFYEPDTVLDVSGGYVHLDPDWDKNQEVRKVFFSSFTTHFGAGANPNSAVTQSAIMAYPTSIHAVLGVWKDCNQDGYVGTIESALLEYQSELLLDQSICPAKEGQDPWAEGFKPSHNDGQWVQELLWIGPDNPELCEEGVSLAADRENNTNPYNFHDGCARVWGDFGLPGDSAGDSCPINPRPRGTYQSVGGFLRYADCLNGYRAVGAINTVAHATGQHDLAFDDADKRRPDQSESPLNADNPYGQPSDDPVVSVFDCSSPGTSVADPTGGSMRYITVTDPTGQVPAGVTDPTGQTGGDDNTIALTNPDGSLVSINGTDDQGNVITLHNVRAPTLNGDGSIGGAVNETLEGTPNVGFNRVGTAFRNETFDDGDCDRSDGFGENSDVYDRLEDDFEGTSSKRVQTDFYHGFVEGTRGDPEEPLGPAAPPFTGQGLHRDVKGVFLLDAPYWFGAPGYAGSRNPYVNRNTLEPWGVVNVTLYAKVSLTAIADYNLDLKMGTAYDVYGADHCDGLLPKTGAFECDPAKWWLGPSGKRIQSDWQVAVGETYNLRDIDCWDTTVAKGTPSATGAFAETACIRPTN